MIKRRTLNTVIDAAERESFLKTKIYDTRTVDRNIWNDLLNKSVVKDVFQTYEWAILMEKIYGYQPKFLIISNRGTVGGQLFFKKKVFFLLSGYEALGGPLYIDSYDVYTISTVIKFFQNLSGSCTSYKLIRPQCPHNFEKEFIKNKFIVSPYQTFLLDLGRPVNKIWNNFKKNARWGVKKAQRSNVKVAEATRWEVWKAFHHLHVEHAKVHRYPVKSLEFMQGLFEILYPKNMTKLFIATYEGAMMAGMLFLICQDTMVYYSGASDSKYPRLLANDLLMWHAIQWGKEHDIRTLNLEDTYPKKSSNLYGIHKFKEKWGGQLTNRDFYIDGKLYAFGRSLVLNSKMFQKAYAIIHERNMI